MIPKEAIKQLEDLQGYVFSETGHLPNDEDETAISVLIEAFKKIQWVPCSERLPEEEGMYLITSRIYGKEEVQYVFYQKKLKLFIGNGIAIAWMPLPEPYKENE